MADAPTKSDAERFREVATAIRDLGMRVSMVVVGDIRVGLSEPWGAERARTGGEMQAEFATESAESTDTDYLKRARVASRKTFGHVKDDAELLRLRGVLTA